MNPVLRNIPLLVAFVALAMLVGACTSTSTTNAHVVSCGDGLIEGDEACDDGESANGDGCDASCAVEAGYACVGAPSDCTPTAPTPTCGDGQVAGAEACDDGRNDDGDGCSATCTVEPGYTCDDTPSSCATTCGDGVIAGDEACDDDGSQDGDGCSATCAIEHGFACDGTPSACDTTCGDGVIAGEELCDDGRRDDGDGCSATCTVEHGFACDGAPSTCASTCGDGVLASDEACDDHDLDPTDGCDALCALEIGFACDGEPSSCATICGDGIVSGVEGCDDHDLEPGDGCGPTCEVEPGFTCTGTLSTCTTTCNDGITAGDEGCDDGRNDDGDGCSATCAVEHGFACADEPSACVSSCGDGLVASNEACDDHRNDDGDGCSADCTVETGFTCDAEPSACDTTCGDGVIAGDETCDDHRNDDGDGCSADCSIEHGFDCAGEPSACLSSCGDGLIASDEACDDHRNDDGDGCSADCAVETGFTCDAEPSACVTTCSDGIIAGAETCDDGNLEDLDGCSPTCVAAAGESCADPLGAWQRDPDLLTPTWHIGADAVTTADGVLVCDPNAHGPDVVIAFDKRSDTVANGGQLLKVSAVSASPTTGNYLNLEVSAQTCDPSGVLKCLWYKQNWDALIDGPPGTYFIIAGKNSPGTFPGADVTIEEVDPADTEGESCFAPYTTDSLIYTAPADVGAPHTWTLPASINSFDMGPRWGEPGSISCDNTASYGDIHGVDAVIAFPKQDPDSVLLVVAQNLDPNLNQSDLNLEVLDTCDPTDPDKTSLNCRANADSVALTAPSGAGTAWIWVSAEATGEEFQGATVEVTELLPGSGGSWSTATPLMGTTTLTSSSTLRLDPPSCFAATDNVAWYSYTLTDNAVSISTSDSVPFAILDTGGQEQHCGADGFGRVGQVGASIIIALAAGVTTTLTITDVHYDGVRQENLSVVDVDLGLIAAPYELAMAGSTLYVGGTSSILSADLDTGVATIHGSADGLTTAHLGYALVAASGSVFAADSTTSTSASRITRAFDGVTWGPTSWDLNPVYPASSPTYAMTCDGAALYLTTRRTGANTNTGIYRLDLAAPGTPVLLGTAGVWYVTGIAIDPSWVYLAGATAAGEGVYRVPRSDLGAAPTLLVGLDTSTTHNPLALDTSAMPPILYAHAYGGDVHAIVGADGAAPAYVGAISTLGTTADYAMTFDPATGALYLLESETTGQDRLIRLE